jgi:ribosomal protein S1
MSSYDLKMIHSIIKILTLERCKKLQSCENFKVKITGANTGGITCMMGGLPAFVPVSQLEKKADGSWWTQEEMVASFSGQEISVAILEVSRTENKIVCSVIRALENDRLRRLEVS